MKVPTVGRIVHYVSYGTPNGEFESECRAAIIAGIPKFSITTVDLVVMSPSGLFFTQSAYSEDNAGGTLAGGTWHWPEGA